MQTINFSRAPPLEMRKKASNTSVQQFDKLMLVPEIMLPYNGVTTDGDGGEMPDCALLLKQHNKTKQQWETKNKIKRLILCIE